METYLSRATQAAQKADSLYAPAGQIHYYDLVLEEASGAMLKDVDVRNTLISLASASATNVGHSHPVVVEAMYQQCKR